MPLFQGIDIFATAQNAAKSAVDTAKQDAQVAAQQAQATAQQQATQIQQQADAKIAALNGGDAPAPTDDGSSSSSMSIWPWLLGGGVLLGVGVAFVKR